jgi:hypothetical protein
LWQDGSTSWHSLSGIKISFLVQSRYSVANKFDKLPAFVGRVKCVLKKESRLFSAMKSRYSHYSHKFGVYVPRNVEEALKIDQET